jgi:HK97 family phage portal protein
MSRSLVATFTAGLASVRRKDAGPVPVRGSGLFGWMREPYAGAWQEGARPEPLAGLLGFSPIYACVSRITNDVAKLSIDLKVAQDDGTTINAPEGSPYWRFVGTPNSYQNRIQFIAYWLAMKLLHGNAYVLKVRDGRGIPIGGHLLDPRRTTPLVSPDGDVWYGIGADWLSRMPNGAAGIPASEIIHDRMNCLWHPLQGVPPLYAAALSGSLGVKIQRNASTFFSNMSRPSGMLTSPTGISDTTALRLKKEWQDNFSEGNIGKLAVAGDGLTYEPMSMAAEQSQLAEILGLTIEDVARAFGVPLYKIGAGQMPTNNNVQALNQQYYSDCLQTLIEAMELCLDEGVGVLPGYGYEFDLDGLLRMDSLTQVDVLTKSTKGGLMKPNEARLKLNLPKVDGGDAVYMQVQDTSLAALARRDKKDPAQTPNGMTPGDQAPPPAPAPPAAPAPAPAPEPTKELDAELAPLAMRLAHRFITAEPEPIE